MYNRLILLPLNPKRSFFLFGPRQVGKSTILKKTYPKSLYIDFLKSDELMLFQEKPSLLRTEYAAQAGEFPIIIDEVQKVPLILDEVHWLIENRKIKFVLCGSSARKLKRGKANLLGGRALHFEMHGLVAEELEAAFSLNKILNRGFIPEHYDADESEYSALIRSYVGDYLKEEIAADALVRNIPAFTSFLSSAALSDTEPVNFATISRDVGVSAHTIKEHFEILSDTMQGSWLPAYSKRQKRRTRVSPKFYFKDVGVVNFLSRRGKIVPGSELFGKAFENYMYHEIDSYRVYKNPDLSLSYWHLTTGVEVDFIFNDMELAVEVKGVTKIKTDHLKGLRELKEDFHSIKNRYIVCLEERPRITEDGIHILPFRDFIVRLWAGEICS
jgi:predicted AAA+ superfamily ATPase